MEEKASRHRKIERWTAGRKAVLVLELIKGQKNDRPFFPPEYLAVLSNHVDGLIWVRAGV
ncbi:MAG: hypothetical protein KKE57_11180 [Proteobacteria bacterium]|nr:hypothetical protein [Pseudomonadota bacterium]